MPGRRQRWLAGLAGRLLAAYLALVARTARIGPFSREQVVLAFWHEYNLAVFAAAAARRGDLPHASFSTRTARGVVIDTVFRSLARAPGLVEVLPLPGESERAAALVLARRLGDLGRTGFSLVVTPDGPWGPYRVAKPGALILARQSGLPILPLAVRARPAFRLGGRWDRQLVPLPFSAITVLAGEPLRLTAGRPLREALARLEADLQRVADAADQRADQPLPSP